MKKIITAFAVALISTAGVMAQSTRTVHGTVIDKNGNPIPGAEVTATGGAETTLTDADGTFTLEVPSLLKSITARYAGMKDRKKKTDFNNNMVFEMKVDKQRYGFLDVVGTVNFNDAETAGAFSLMGGMLANWGFYVKAGVNIGEGYYYDSDCWFLSASAGVVKRITTPLYCYLGIGWSYLQYKEVFYYDYDYSYEESWTDSEPGLSFDAGLIYRIGTHFNVMAGYTHINSFSGGHSNNCINIGLGYVF